jgi:hypothetical protein
MRLDRLDWQAAAIELDDEHRRSGAPRARRALAALSSLRGRFSDDFTVAAASAVVALRLEPLDPAHRVREALVRLRFGDLDGAVARLDALPEGVAELPLVLVIKALAIARRGEPRTARNIADRALQLDARHAAARFLYAETNLLAQAKGGLDKLAELPRGAVHDAAWADLLAKLAVVRGDHRAVTQHLDRGVITKGSAADRLVRAVVAWTMASADELAAAAAAQPEGSRAEQVALGLLLRALEQDPAAAATALRRLQQRLPERAAIRRAFVVALTRLAVAEAAADRLSAALRAVQVCLELEPHEPAHHQNRAALFTLLGEHEAALDAWAELDRHHYRLALLGRLDPEAAQRYGAPHRMAAQAARLAGTGGVFLVEEERRGAVVERQLTVNQEALDRDPEQLRQWLHHSRAALLFAFVGLGGGAAVLLSPSSPAEAEARAEGLGRLTHSLAVLVPEEGRLLGEALAKQLRGTAAGATMRYAATQLGAEAQAVHRLALELYAELALLCLRWEPDPARRELGEELLETVRAVAPFFDERVLEELLELRRDAAPHALGFLQQALRVILELSERAVRLNPGQRRRFEGVLAANVRVSAVERRTVEAQGTLTRHDVEQLVEQLEGARRDDPRSAKLEYWCAHLLMMGDFLDEARQAIARFHEVAGGDHPLTPRIARIQELLDEKQQRGDGKQRQAGDRLARLVAGDRDERDLAAREAELERQPTSMHLYTELCYQLALADRWRDAHAWAGRALARCLTPAGQLRARELGLELAGLEPLAAADAGAMARFVTGARASALPAIEQVCSAAGERVSAALEYVRGLALLAADRHGPAQAAFASALARCSRGIHLAVLRPLANDVESAVLTATRAELDAAVAEGRLREAFERIVERMTSVTHPEPYVLELARIQLAALLPTIGTGDSPQAPPPIRVAAPWHAELTAALAPREPVARIRATAELAARLHEPSAREAAGLGRKLDELGEQLRVAAVLRSSTELAAAGNLGGALETLATAGAGGERNARVLRQRALLLLKLERFDEAQATIDKLAELPDPLARELVARYPALLFRQRIASGSARVREKEFAVARRVLEACQPAAPEQEVELAYCRAYCAAAEGYRAHREGLTGDAQRLLLEALTLVESKLSEARTLRHERLLELHQKLEADVGLIEGPR